MADPERENEELDKLQSAAVNSVLTLWTRWIWERMVQRTDDSWSDWFTKNTGMRIENDENNKNE